jgi:hypothetical protein
VGTYRSVRDAPRARAEALERRRSVPPGNGERTVGYGVWELPFETGHVLAFRRVVASTAGPPSVSVWHRDPDGRWTLYVDVEPRESCARYVSAAMDRVRVAAIELAWTGPERLGIAVPAHRLHWSLRVRGDAVTRGLNGLLRILPDAVVSAPVGLRVLGATAGPLLGAGPLPLTGRMPNGQRHRSLPTSLWRVTGSAAGVGGRELGRVRSQPEQPALGGVPVGNRGLLVFDTSSYETFDSRRHADADARSGTGRAGGGWVLG